MTRPLDRPDALLGRTYKIKWLDSDHAFYITINDIEKDGRRRPFEIFINSKNMEAYAWALALTRMISAVFRRGGDVSFVVDELKAMFDPRGGQWMGGRYVPSLLAAIGEVIERHMVEIGFMGRARRRACEAVALVADRRGRRAGALLPALRRGQLCQARRLRFLSVLRLFQVRLDILSMRLLQPLLALCAAGAVSGARRLGDGPLVGGGRRVRQEARRPERPRGGARRDRLAGTARPFPAFPSASMWCSGICGFAPKRPHGPLVWRQRTLRPACPHLWPHPGHLRSGRARRAWPGPMIGGVRHSLSFLPGSLARQHHRRRQGPCALRSRPGGCRRQGWRRRRIHRRRCPTAYAPRSQGRCPGSDAERGGGAGTGHALRRSHPEAGALHSESRKTRPFRAATGRTGGLDGRDHGVAPSATARSSQGPSTSSQATLTTKRCRPPNCSRASRRCCLPSTEQPALFEL